MVCDQEEVTSKTILWNFFMAYIIAKASFSIWP